MGKQAILSLLPNLLAEPSSEEPGDYQFSKSVVDRVISLDGLIAENEKEGRRYLKRFSFSQGKSFRDIPIKTLNEHTNSEELQELLTPILQGQSWGLISDAGLPCIADPGAQLVSLARKKEIFIEAFAGPSSIFLSLMLSGLGGQCFAFHGYLSRESEKVRQEIQRLEKESAQKKMTQICIEAPYRSNQLLEALLEVLQDQTRLSISSDLTGGEAYTHTMSVREWKKKSRPDLHKKPTVFLFLAG